MITCLDERGHYCRGENSIFRRSISVKKFFLQYKMLPWQQLPSAAAPNFSYLLKMKTVFFCFCFPFPQIQSWVINSWLIFSTSSNRHSSFAAFFFYLKFLTYFLTLPFPHAIFSLLKWKYIFILTF